MTQQPIDDMHDALLRQAKGCLRLGSTMYGDLFLRLAQDYASGGVVAQILGSTTATPLHDATPLRLAGTMHRIVLDDLDDALAHHYPSVGGAVGESFAQAFLDAMPRHKEAITDGLQRQVQTNEVGRSVVPLALVHWLGLRGVTEVTWYEIGASAGLNLSFDRFGADTGSGVMGDENSTVWFSPEWFEIAPPVCASPARVVARRGVDISPINIHNTSDASRLRSFVWPDQTDRFDRMDAAIAIAQDSAHTVDNSSADSWLDELLNTPRTGATVVFHSIVWQYLGHKVHDGIRDALARAGQSATQEQPLVWARMEPAGDVADVRVTVWDGSSTSESVLATVGYHGQHMRWLY